MHGPTHPIIVSSIAAFVSGLGVLFDPYFIATGIIETRILLFAVLVGAIGGALLSFFFRPKNEQTAAWVSGKILGSGITSLIFSPMIIQAIAKWLKVDITPEWVLGVSGAVALCSVAVIRGIRAFASGISIRDILLRVLMKGNDERKDK